MGSSNESYSLPFKNFKSHNNLMLLFFMEKINFLPKLEFNPSNRRKFMIKTIDLLIEKTSIIYKIVL